MLSVRNLVIWIHLILSVVSGATGSDLNILNDTSTRLFRLRRQSDCDYSRFRCDSGECIDEDLKCDGHVDCPDGSDETTNRCKNLRCPSYLFRCKYGACISSKLVCDGKSDCRDASDENGPNCTKTSASSKCKYGQFECKSGQCISEDNKCDGTPDCTDLSDETAETCLRFPCPGYTFKCRYGACISKNGVCNGISDCFDDSDEDPALCRDRPTVVTPVTPRVPVTRPPVVTPSVTRPPVTRPPVTKPPPVTSPGSCPLPDIQNGNTSVYGSSYSFQPGDRIEAGSIVTVSCRKGYTVVPESFIITCSSGNWKPRAPKCERSCPPLVSTPTMEVSCHKNGVERNCNEPVDHTTAEFKCIPFYELTTTKSYRYCFEGTWDEEKPSCKPVCGQKRANPKPLIIGGEVVKRGNYPWTVALYRQKGDSFALICGGSLINQRVIVTAAHCVTDTIDGVKRDKSLYRVSAGKFYLSYDDKRDNAAEFSELEEIIVHEEYKGSTFDFENDIAVLVTKERFNTTEFIQRVCVDWNRQTFYEGQLLGENGIVTGWGYTVRGANQSTELKEISLPYIDRNTCYTAMSEEYKKYVKKDKICAGYKNEGIGVCEGDSGGGLVFKKVEDSRFYLRGIVSVAPQVGGNCNEYEYAFYTKVSSYINFLLEIERRYQK